MRLHIVAREKVGMVQKGPHAENSICHSELARNLREAACGLACAEPSAGRRDFSIGCVTLI